MVREQNGVRPEPERRRYEILLTKAAQRDLAKLPVNAQRRVDAAIQSLADDPRPAGVKKLRDVGELYRVRAGDYRIVYQIEDAMLIVLVVRIGDRRDIYRDL